MCSEGFFANFFKKSKSFVYFRDFSFSERCQKGRWLISEHDFKGGVNAVCMFPAIVNEFEDWEMGGPVSRIQDAIDGKIGFDFLVETFCGSIRLGMEGGGHRRLDSEGFHEFSKDLGGKTGVAIGNQLVGKSKTFEQVGHKEVSGS